MSDPPRRDRRGNGRTPPRRRPDFRVPPNAGSRIPGGVHRYDHLPLKSSAEPVVDMRARAEQPASDEARAWADLDHARRSRETAP